MESVLTRAMLSILIGHSYFLRLDRKQFERAKPYPPLATLQTAALLRQAGHRVALFDAMLAEGISDYLPLLEMHTPQVLLLYEDNFNFLSKMCLSRMREAAFAMIEAASRRDCFVIVAGSDASDASQRYLQAGANVVLLGEGLASLQILLARLDHHPRAAIQELTAGLRGIASAAWSQPRRPAAADLLPTALQPALPAWDLIDMRRYREIWQEAHGFFSLNMSASRGCSFRCNWCAKPIWGNQYLQRDAGEVAAEMGHLKRNYAPDHIWFADDIFGFRADWVEAFARATRASQGGVPFTIQTRADLVSPRMAQALADSGCREAWIGAESGSQKILDAMNKGTTVAEILTARARLRERGIRVGFFIQIGYLNESLEDLLATRELIEKARPDDIGVSVSYPLPGTKFHEQVKEQLRGQTHWRESDDLAMMFAGTYRSEFYRAVRDLLHEQVNLSNLSRAYTGSQHQDAWADLRYRWDGLMVREHQYRGAQAALSASI